MRWSDSWVLVPFIVLSAFLEESMSDRTDVLPGSSNCFLPVTPRLRFYSHNRNRKPKRKRYKVITGGNSRNTGGQDHRGQRVSSRNCHQPFQAEGNWLRRNIGLGTNWKTEDECKGYENFIHDLEVLSLELTVIGYMKASVAWFLHLLNQAYGFISVYFIGGKERITFIINLVRPETIPDDIERWFGILGFLDYLVTRYLSYPLGNLIFVIDTIGQTLGLISLVIDVLTTFHDVFGSIFQNITGIDLKMALRNYACDNPFEQGDNNIFPNALFLN